MKLDLGSGPEPVEGFEGVDREPVTDHVFDLATGWDGWRWPWDDNSIEALRSSHFIEHIPAESAQMHCPVQQRQLFKDLLVHFFDEAWRVIEPGGTFELFWPPLQSTFAFQDPTHRRFIPARQLMYFSREFRDNNRLGFLNAQCNWVVRDFSATLLRPDEEPDLDTVATLHGAKRAAEIIDRQREQQWNRISEYHAVLVAVKP